MATCVKIIWGLGGLSVNVRGMAHEHDGLPDARNQRGLVLRFSNYPTPSETVGLRVPSVELGH